MSLEPLVAQEVPREMRIEGQPRITDLYLADEIEPAERAVMRKAVGGNPGVGAVAVRAHAAAAVGNFVARRIRGLVIMPHRVHGDSAGPSGGGVTGGRLLEQKNGGEQRHH